jgi:hypothetical protein
LLKLEVGVSVRFLFLLSFDAGAEEVCGIIKMQLHHLR